MKSNFTHLLTLLFLITILLSCSKEEDVEPGPEAPNPTRAESRAAELSIIVGELANTDLSVSDQELSPLAALGDASIVGLGEATHNTKEFFVLKHRIFKYLVENHGFRIFAIEADVGESFYLDQYIRTGIGDLNALMKDTMQFWVWRTQEVKAMIEWMKDYNTGLSPENQIRYFGIDCQYTRHTSQLSKDFLLSTLPEKTTQIVQYFSGLDSLNNRLFSDLPQTEKNRMKSQVDSIQLLYTSHELEITANSSFYDYQYYLKMVNQMGQVWDFLTAPSSIERFNVRDRNMADNTTAIRDFFDTNEKMVLWAHNGHIRDNQTDGISTVGHHLNQELPPDEYQSLIFYFSYGKFNAWNGSSGLTSIETFTIDYDPWPDSINDVFSKVEASNFILRTNDSGIEDLEFWLNSDKLALEIGSVFYPDIAQSSSSYYNNCNLRTTADFVVYINETRAADMLE